MERIGHFLQYLFIYFVATVEGRGEGGGRAGLRTKSIRQRSKPIEPTRRSWYKVLEFFYDIFFVIIISARPFVVNAKKWLNEKVMMKMKANGREDKLSGRVFARFSFIDAP